MVFIKERIGKMLEYLKEQIYPESMPIQKYRMIKTDKRFENLQIQSFGAVTESITGLRLL